MSGTGIANDWSSHFGLALAPLFETGEASEHKGEHHVLLDGGFGSFALSHSPEELWRSGEPANWAWSSNIPHHVTVTESKVAVVRWDSPRDAKVYERTGVERSLDRFYGYLNEDRLRSNRGVVDHLLNLFRRVRSLAHHAEIPDTRSIDVYLATLAHIISEDVAALDGLSLGLAEDAVELCARIPSDSLKSAIDEAVSAPRAPSQLKLCPSLAIRHAGGQLFQEAHFELLRVSPQIDLFGLVDAPETRASNRGGTHFTPPALARSIVEQVLGNVEQLSQRQRLVLTDPACGSGAFLHEALRALRREGFEGRLELIGIDTSPTAIAMAKFALSMSLRDWSPQGGVDLQLKVGDALGEPGIPNSDVIVMNPPFISFGSQTPKQRQQLREATDTSATRGDYSMAFVARALEALNDGGFLGSLFPASLLSLKAAATWRERLAEEGDIRVLASIGDFGLFSHAMVQVAFAVVRKGPPSGAPLMAMTSENDPDATGEALRQVRKLGTTVLSGAVLEKHWSLHPVSPNSLAKRATWRLPTPKSERLLEELADLSLPTVSTLFEVSQGIQTGLNEALLLKYEDWRALPVKERSFFRKATKTDSIQNGHVVKPYYVFFPHTVDGALFENEESVAQSVPKYFQNWLAPNRKRLESRATIIGSRRVDWWGLMRSRSWAFDRGARIISKFFAAEGGFVSDLEAEYLPVMGHVWIPREILSDTDEDASPLADIVAAYSALFNSTPFVRLLSLYSPHVAGGQFDLSARHVNPIPIPDLRALNSDPNAGQHISELASLGRAINLTEQRWRSRCNRIVAELYGSQSLENDQ